MCTYTYAPLCAVRGNTGVEKEETLLPLWPPHRVSSSRYLLSSYSIFTHCTGSLSLSFHPVFVCYPPHIPSFSAGFLFYLCALSYRLGRLSLARSPCPSSLSSSLVPSFVTMHLVSSTAAAPICCCRYVVAADETSRCTRICAQKKRTPFCGT